MPANTGAPSRTEGQRLVQEGLTLFKERDWNGRGFELPAGLLSSIWEVVDKDLERLRAGGCCEHIRRKLEEAEAENRAHWARWKALLEGWEKGGAALLREIENLRNTLEGEAR